MFSKVQTFWQEARQEFIRVNWPTFSETMRLTMIVIVFSVAVAMLLGVLDTIFTFLLGKII
ncbi:MAG: preprotein translocase subunit SecE [Patescibacteria group bacterium]